MTRPAALALAAALAALPLAGAAQEIDYLVTDGKLGNEDFYRLVSCRAMPGGPCTADPVRWSPEAARDLAVGFAELPPDYPAVLAERIEGAVDRAIREINDAGAGLRLRRAVKDEDPDISVHLAHVGEGDRISGTGVRGVDGQVIGAALVTVWWDSRRHLTDAVIVLAEDLPAADIGPVVLEEMTQAMGLMTDIRNPAYEGVSVFSEDSNRVTRLGPQDREALRRHYPPEDP